MRAREFTESLRTKNPCWKGYHPVGTKKKKGKTVPNCVPIAESADESNDELKPGEFYIWKIYFDDGTNKRIKVTSDNFDPVKYYAQKNQTVIKVDYSWEPQR